MTSRSLQTDLLTEPFVLEGGTIGVPKDAGLGVEVNDDTLRRYLTARWVVE